MSERDSDAAPPAMDAVQPYNERLFGPGLRGWVHRGRFRWLGSQYQSRYGSPPSVIEVGCHDGKTLEYLTPAPRRYLGLDANHEHGIDLGRVRWADQSWAEFEVCHTAEQMPSDERFDLSVSMETLEHIPDDVLDGYLERLSEITDGFLLVTVPNEIGPVCFTKQVLKKLFLGGSRFSWADIGNATLGRTDRIVRDDHRGFDYRSLIERLRQSFEVISVQGIPFPFLPPYLNVTIGVVATPRRQG